MNFIEAVEKMKRGRVATVKNMQYTLRIEDGIFIANNGFEDIFDFQFSPDGIMKTNWELVYDPPLYELCKFDFEKKEITIEKRHLKNAIKKLVSSKCRNKDRIEEIFGKRLMPK